MVFKLALRLWPPVYAPKRCRKLYRRHQSTKIPQDVSALRAEMTSRELPYVEDYMTTKQCQLLRLTLNDFLPDSAMLRKTLNPGHHLVYFPSATSPSSLLPDGTDALHSPGSPYNRRMWAGGRIQFNRKVQLDGSPFCCQEHISDVQVRGQGSDEKVFVKIDRRIYPGPLPGHKSARHGTTSHLAEQRTLVFVQDRRQDGSADANESSNKILKPTQAPDFSHDLVPTRELLFRFSALTFNAHAIHLDRLYCREKEGHRNLLVHGPLSLVLMIEVLRGYIMNKLGVDSEYVTSVEYRNLAPLYAEEQMRVCVKKKDNGDRRTRTWAVWIEGRDGGYAVKGTVRTLTVYSTKSQQKGSFLKAASP